mmetsp:Transcript_10734/g.22871  ORF Transcript_10734/g.22871 Transcript_10734/m.22871 type:complete len:261 (-) Transcript_10734:1005-1787(-)
MVSFLLNTEDPVACFDFGELSTRAVLGPSSAVLLGSARGGATSQLVPDEFESVPCLLSIVCSSLQPIYSLLLLCLLGRFAFVVVESAASHFTTSELVAEAGWSVVGLLLVAISVVAVVEICLFVCTLELQPVAFSGTGSLCEPGLQIESSGEELSDELLLLLPLEPTTELSLSELLVSLDVSASAFTNSAFTVLALVLPILVLVRVTREVAVPSPRTTTASISFVVRLGGSLPGIGLIFPSGAASNFLLLFARVVMELSR